MAVIILGNNTDTVVGNVTPITIPVDSLPIPGLTVLTNPLILAEFGNTSETSSLWYRNNSAGYIRPGTISDRVGIGTGSFVSDEQLRVNGKVQANSYYLPLGAYLNVTDNELSFTDSVSGSVKLSDLINPAISQNAVDVNVTDAGSYYNGTNVEDVLQEIATTFYTNFHTHSNLALLETYTNTNADISTAITNTHAALTIGTANGLSLNVQELSLSLADTSTVGALSNTDWNTFNNKLDATDTLSAIKDLLLSTGSIIQGVDSTTASILSIGTSGQVLSVKSDLSGLEWTDLNIQSNFEVPTGFTSISNEIGDINNTEYPTVSALNSLTLLEILQNMLFPAPTVPTFVNPTCSITVTPSGSSPSTMFNGTYVETGGSATIGVTSSLTSTNGPGGHAYAIADGSPSFTKNAIAFTTGTSVTFSANTTFAVSYPYRPNGIGEVSPEYTTLSNGSTVYANAYTGANSGNATNSKTYTIVDPIYYGSYTTTGSGDDNTQYPTQPTQTDIVARCTKLVSIEPSTQSITVTTYTGSVDTHKFIAITYPSSYGTLSRIDYVEGGNANVIGSFTTTTFTYTRPDTTTVDYRIYYALNSYANVTGTVTYTARF